MSDISNNILVLHQTKNGKEARPILVSLFKDFGNDQAFKKNAPSHLETGMTMLESLKEDTIFSNFGLDIDYPEDENNG